MARVVFFGSPDFAVPALRSILPTEYRPILVVSQPDRPAGRGKKLSPTPVRAVAESNQIPVKVVESFKRGDAIAYLESLEPEFFVVVAFGLIFPPEALGIASKGNINVHASLLPAYRGASPINRAIINGDTFTGITTMEMEEGLDSGPIYLQRIVPVDPMEDAGSLSQKLAEEGASLLFDTLKAIDAGTLRPIAQPEAGVSFAPRLKKKDGFIPWEKDALSVHNHIRGMNPWPGSFTFCRGSYLKIRRAEPYDLAPHPGSPGLIVDTHGERILVACGSGTVAITRLQAEGKRPLDAGEFLRGFPIEAGAILGKQE